MFLLGKKIRAKHLESFVEADKCNQYPLKLEDEECIRLYHLYKDEHSNKQDRDEAFKKLIFGHLRLTIFIAGKHSAYLGQRLGRKSRNLDEDMIDEAILGMIMVLQRGIDHDNITGAISHAVYRRLYSFLRRERRYNRRNRSLVLIKTPFKQRFSKSDSDNDIRDMWEIVEKSLISKKQRDVFELRYQGYNDVEISKKLGLSKRRVGQIRRIIQERFNKLIEE